MVVVLVVAAVLEVVMVFWTCTNQEKVVYFWSQPAIWAIIHGRTVLSEGKHKFAELLKTSNLAYDEHIAG